MDCERHNQNLSAYLDGRLSRKETSHVEIHIERCRRCREELAELRRLKEMLAALPDTEPTPGFWNRSLDNVRSASTSPGSVARIRVRQGLALCAGVACTFLVTALTRVEAPTSIAPPSAPATINADSLVALHTSLRTETPLADTGTLRFAHTNGIASDWANDHQLDFE